MKSTYASLSRNGISLAAAVTSLALISGNSTSWAQETFKIGHLSDLSGINVDISGPGTTVAMQFAVDDFGGQVLDRPIEIVAGDHLNKPDVGVGLARKWYDEDVHAIFDVGITSVALGIQALAREKNKAVIYLSTGSADLTGKNCSPNGIHWTYNSYSDVLGSVLHATENGGDTWYFLTVDYAYGDNLQRDATTILEKAGGTVVGSARHPFETPDFSSDLLRAQSSGAKVIGLATTTNIATNIVKQSDEFGIRQGQTIALMSVDIQDIKAMGLETAHGLIDTSSYYWDLNDESRAFGERFMEKTGRMPNMMQASAYGAVLHYLNAVEAAGTDDPAQVLASMKEMPVNDFMTTNGSIRPDGRVLREMHILEVKSPEESTGEWDVYNLVRTIPADEAFAPADPSVCDLAR